ARSIRSTVMACPTAVRRWLVAAGRVSGSPNPSATSGSYPARLADAASARPEAAAISTGLSLSIYFVRKSERVAEIQAHGFCRFDHFLEQPKLGPVLDIADGERTNAQSGVRIYLHPACHYIQAFNTGRGNCVHVANDEKGVRPLDLGAREDADPRTAGAQGDLTRRQDAAFFGLVAAICGANLDAETRFDLGRTVAYTLDAIVADKCDVCVLQGRNNSS